MIRTTTVDQERQLLLDELLDGLRRPQKMLPSKYFYDEIGSALFEDICALTEYYPTRTEIGIMENNIRDIARHLGSRCLLIEYGSGASVKIRLLLDHLRNIAGYVPIDISAEHLLAAVDELRQEYPTLPIFPVPADYTQDFDLPEIEVAFHRRVVYFPGSTIGNFTPDQARDFLRHVAEVAGEDGGLLIGADLKKDVSILEAAYNDTAGVTADFNLNMLVRLNREFDADFDLDAFRHRAVYNPREGRIEMHLISRREQIVSLAGEQFGFHANESILTEYSYKYTLEEFAALAAPGFRVEKVWVDAKRWFSVQYLTVRQQAMQDSHSW
ncbi:MAG: L-histidine N(alpha)-methyltransferase [Bacteroidetes bacterium]|nr:L-histidine N(alpha)-methyltransferase [Bacteroidota bacterium]